MRGHHQSAGEALKEIGIIERQRTRTKKKKKKKKVTKPSLHPYANSSNRLSPSSDGNIPLLAGPGFSGNKSTMCASGPSAALGLHQPCTGSDRKRSPFGESLSKAVLLPAHRKQLKAYTKAVSQEVACWRRRRRCKAAKPVKVPRRCVVSRDALRCTTVT